MTTLETPMGLALVVCDTIIEDKLTGKKTLVGLFDRVHSAHFPCVHPAMSVFVSMTGGRGEYPCEILCQHMDGATLAFSAKGKVALSDPRKAVDLVFRLQGVRFPIAGVYWIRFLVDSVPIMMRQLLVQQQESAPPTPPTPPPEAPGL